MVRYVPVGGASGASCRLARNIDTGDLPVSGSLTRTATRCGVPRRTAHARAARNEIRYQSRDSYQGRLMSSAPASAEDEAPRPPHQLPTQPIRRRNGPPSHPRRTVAFSRSGLPPCPIPSILSDRDLSSVSCRMKPPGPRSSSFLPTTMKLNLSAVWDPVCPPPPRHRSGPLTCSSRNQIRHCR